MNALLKVDFETLVDIWEELVLAFNGVNHYGGDTAEIYAFNLIKYRPVLSFNEFRDDDYCAAADIIVEICLMFQQKHNCKVEIDGQAVLRKWRIDVGSSFKHRCHIKITKSKKRRNS